MIYSSPRPAVDIPPVSLGDYVFEHASRWGDRPAIIDASTGHSLSFAEVRLGAQRVAAALAQRGWRKGDVMAVVCPNVPEFAIAFHGVGLAGGVVTTASPSASHGELAFQLRDSGAGCPDAPCVATGHPKGGSRHQYRRVVHLRPGGWCG